MPPDLFRLARPPHHSHHGLLQLLPQLAYALAEDLAILTGAVQAQHLQTLRRHAAAAAAAAACHCCCLPLPVASCHCCYLPWPPLPAAAVVCCRRRFLPASPPLPAGAFCQRRRLLLPLSAGVVSCRRGFLSAPVTGTAAQSSCPGWSFTPGRCGRCTLQGLIAEASPWSVDTWAWAAVFLAATCWAGAGLTFCRSSETRSTGSCSRWRWTVPIGHARSAIQARRACARAAASVVAPPAARRRRRQRPSHPPIARASAPAPSGGCGVRTRGLGCEWLQVFGGCTATLSLPVSPPVLARPFLNRARGGPCSTTATSPLSFRLGVVPPSVVRAAAATGSGGVAARRAQATL
eukprot:365973-Chlamydomonas_euryale.AAC.16